MLDGGRTWRKKGKRGDYLQESVAFPVEKGRLFCNPKATILSQRQLVPTWPRGRVEKKAHYLKRVLGSIPK